MNTILQKDYVQKSKIFLLPLLNLKRTFKASNSYCSAPSLVSENYPLGININSKILIVSYPKRFRDISIKNRDEKFKNKNDILKTLKNKEISLLENELKNEPEQLPLSDWEKFEIDLLSHNRFLAFHDSDDELIYTFDLANHYICWNAFVDGKYSLFDEKSKTIILEYRRKDLTDQGMKKMFCYLYPYKRECLVEFARDLALPVEELEQVKELCNKPDFEKEEYICEYCQSLV